MVFYNVKARTGWYNKTAMLRKQVSCRDCGFLALKIMKGLRRLSFHLEELTLESRGEIADGTYYDPGNRLVCYKTVWSDDDPTLAILNSMKRCPHFFRFRPGYSPDEHKQLERGKKRQRIKIIGIIVTLISAATAIIATSIAD